MDWLHFRVFRQNPLYLYYKRYGKPSCKHTNGGVLNIQETVIPFKIIYTELHDTKGIALKREAEIKSLGKDQKLKLEASLQTTIRINVQCA